MAQDLREKGGRDVEAFNTTFAQAIVDIGVGVEMCAPRRGNQFPFLRIIEEPQPLLPFDPSV